jgi:hypothetical protein
MPRPRSCARFAPCCLLLAACGPWSCGKGDASTPPPAAAAQQAALAEQTDPPAAPGDAPAAPAAEAPPKPKWPKEGFSEVTIVDRAPICVFESYRERGKAEFVDAAQRQKLRAGATVVFGAFAPWCVNEACDQRPSIQCQVEREGNTLVLHTKYWGDHKDGATCTDNCRPILAGCETPELEAGRYTVQHGEQVFELKIPSVLRYPCFEPPNPATPE